MPRSKNFVARPSDVPPALRFDPTDRGWTLTVPGAKTVGPFEPRALLVALGVGGVALGGAGVMAADVTELVLLAVPILAFSLIAAVVAASVARARGLERGRLTLDGPSVEFHALEGPVRFTLEDLKAVDVVPVGLAFRLRRGPAVHFAMPKVDDADRAWLRDRLRAAAERHGRPDEVPEALRGIARKETT